MIKGIDHIGIAVKDLEKSILFYQEIMGLELKGIEEVKKDDVRIAFMDAKNVKIELISPISQSSGVAKFLNNRGEGIHHISYEVDNIKESLNHLKGKDIGLVDKEPRLGAHNKLVAFLHPKSTFGVLVEFCESSK
jgi:methylmalonyl-CoA epimerase